MFPFLQKRLKQECKTVKCKSLKFDTRAKHFLCKFKAFRQCRAFTEHSYPAYTVELVLDFVGVSYARVLLTLCRFLQVHSKSLAQHSVQEDNGSLALALRQVYSFLRRISAYFWWGTKPVVHKPSACVLDRSNANKNLRTIHCYFGLTFSIIAYLKGG